MAINVFCTFTADNQTFWPVEKGHRGGLDTTKHEVWFSEVSALDFLYYDMAKVSSFFNGQEGRNFAWEFCKLDTNNLFR